MLKICVCHIVICYVNKITQEENMNTKIALMITVSGLLILQGCTFVVSPYSASFNNIEKMKAIDNKFATERFSSNEPGKNTITCRGAGPVSTPNKDSYEDFIYEAFVSDLKLAGLFDSESSLKVKGNFKKIDFSSSIGNGKWFFIIDLISNSGKKIEVSSTYSFSTSFIGDRACQQVAGAFIPAVQQFIGDIISHPDFRELIQ